MFFMEESFGNFFHHAFQTWPGKILALHSIRHVQFANRNRTLSTNTSVKLCLLTKMPMRTIFFRKPNLSPQQLFLLAVAIVLFVGYTLLEKKSLRADSLVHAEHHQVTSKVTVTSETKSQLSEPSLTYGEKDFFFKENLFEFWVEQYITLESFHSIGRIDWWNLRPWGWIRLRRKFMK